MIKAYTDANASRIKTERKTPKAVELGPQRSRETQETRLRGVYIRAPPPEVKPQHAEFRGRQDTCEQCKAPVLQCQCGTMSGGNDSPDPSNEPSTGLPSGEHANSDDSNVADDDDGSDTDEPAGLEAKIRTTKRKHSGSDADYVDQPEDDGDDGESPFSTPPPEESMKSLRKRQQTTKSKEYS